MTSRSTGTALGPRLDPFSLRFADSELEDAYKMDHAQSVLQVTRFGLLLAASLYVYYGVIDYWEAREQLRYLWPLRGSMFIVLLAAFFFTWHELFTRHHQRISLLLVLLTGINVCALMAVMPTNVMNQQHTALVLVIIGGFTLLGLEFVYTFIAGVILFATYLILELFFSTNSFSSLMVNTGYIASAVVLASLGAHASDKNRRLAYHSRLAIERERHEIHHISLHDPLTGLANRRLLLEKLAQASARDDRFKTMTAVLFIDLNDFKRINDTHGHAFGDDLLKAASERLTSSVRTTDTVARFGGDEFVVLLEDLKKPDDLGLSIKRIRAAFVAPCDIDNVSVELKLSIGYAIHPIDSEDPGELLEIADRSMYQMKGRSPRH